MSRALAVAVVFVSLAACNKKPPSDFDARWQKLAAAADPAVVGPEKGNALTGEVRRAAESAPSRDGGKLDALITGELPDPVVAGVIRSNLNVVKACYAIEERAGTVSGGKAIVSLEIKESGDVQNVSVDAPAFADSKLPECIRNNARNWTFPKFTTGPKKFSYPFVFVGG
jgi:hypothetical protein